MEYKQVLCIRKDLKMTTGKIAAQAAHASIEAYDHARTAHPAWVSAWKHTGTAKIALKLADEKQLLDVAAVAITAGLPVAIITDAGHTQVDPGTRTVCGIGPAPANLIDAITGLHGSHPLKLL